jgi:hypothetical protein
MTVNCGSKLSKRYFKSYIGLHMNAYECSLEEAKEKAYHRLFKGNEHTYGIETYTNFVTAYEEMREIPHEERIAVTN